MTGKLILTGLKERLKVYAGIGLLYLLYGVGSAIFKPTPRMDHLVDWLAWSYEVLGVEIYAMTFILMGMAAAALLVAEIIFFVRDFYSPNAYQLFSLPVNGKQVVGSRLGLFLLDFLFLVVLDLPFRLPFYRTLFSSLSGGQIGWIFPSLVTSDWVYLGILSGATGMLVLAIVPLLTYLLIAAAKCLFDLSAGWLTAFLALGYGAFLGLCYLLASIMPPLVQMTPGSETYSANPLIPILLMITVVVIFWSGTRIIDRRLNI